MSASAIADPPQASTNHKKPYNRVYEDPNQKTPYQGKRRTFGVFHCLTCNIEWSSANTWANKGQDCFACMKNTYPYRQFKLQKGSGKDKNKPHPQQHCEMCKDLKKCCRTIWAIDQEKSEEQSGDKKKSKKKNRSRRRKGETAAVPNEE